MAEMYGKVTGCSRGRGGSMHFFDAARHFYGGYAIVGGGLPIALGLALADKLQGRDRVTACFFGEGAAAEGEFHESMNLAELWSLPVLFLCENNRYAMGTAVELSETVTSMAEKARAYRLPAETVDGMDVLAVESATRRAADAVRGGEGPQFVEFETYRFRAHSMADPDLYRSKDEIERWKLRDPIAGLRSRLEAAGLLSGEDAETIEQRVAAVIDDAVAFAETSPWEPVEDLLKYLVTD
jgi:TPP-dependent pyruvate/acetoin dehydrogenase alpha subunit